MARGHERPLGLKADVPVTPTQLDQLQKIERVDLQKAAEAAAEVGEIPEGKVEAAQLALKRFFALPVLRGEEHAYSLGPSRAIDSLWHNFILDTPRYVRFSEDVFGGYLHHRPSVDSSDDYTSAALRWFVPATRGRALVMEFFEDPDLDLWPEDSTEAIICYIH